MGSISVRGIDETLSARLKANASGEEKSLNQYVLDVLKREVGLLKEQRFTAKHHDLDHLFGAWTPDEFEAINTKLSADSVIDEELWK